MTDLHIDVLAVDPLSSGNPRLIRRADPDDPSIGQQVREGTATYVAISEPHTMDDCPYDEARLAAVDEMWAHEAIHLWFSLSYANYLVLNRSVLQSMPDEWQARFVGCLRELDAAFGHLEHPTYDVRCLARQGEHIMFEDCETCDGTGKRLDGGIPVEPEEPCEDCDGDGQNDCDRWETAEEIGVITDPIPHYNRGRTRLEPRS